MTDDLVAFLWARLDEDEQAARLATGSDGLDVIYVSDPSGHIQPPDGLYADGSPRFENRRQNWMPLYDPAGALRDIEAKRQLIDWAVAAIVVVTEDSYNLGPVTPLQLLALRYADEPDYREEWRP